jgi:hypothetical protein
MRSLCLALLLVSLFTARASAQNLGRVFGPDVARDDRGAAYRFAVSGENANGDSSYAQRLHYQRAVSDTLRWRAIINFRDRPGSDFELDHVQGELLWQLIERTPGGFSSGLRLDTRLSEGDNTPHQLGVNWTSQWVLDNGWRARAILLFDRDIGPDARDDVFVQTRARLSRGLENGVRIGLESFNSFGGIDAGFGSFDDQRHQLGLAADIPLGEGWGVGAGLLLGVSDAAPDHDVQLRVSRSFPVSR